MNNHGKVPTKKLPRLPRLTLTTAFVLSGILAIAAVALASRQPGRVAGSPGLDSNLQTGKTSELSSLAGQMKELSPDEAQKLAGGLKELVNQSTEGLVEVRHANGTVSVNLEDRFQSVTVARVNKDGSISQSCVDNPKAAGAFFGIDPNLIDPSLDTRGRKARISPARSNN